MENKNLVDTSSISAENADIGESSKNCLTCYYCINFTDRKATCTYQETIPAPSCWNKNNTIIKSINGHQAISLNTGAFITECPTYKAKAMRIEENE